MEQVLDVYKRPYSVENPVVCMDESPRQLIKETRIPIEMKSGSVKRIDYEYQRCGTCNIFMACEPLAGKRYVKITKTKTKKDWAVFIKEVSALYPSADKITLVMDNYCTHKPSSFYEIFSPEESKKIWDRSEVGKWQENRNNKNAKIDWQFRTENARIKLKRLYPSYHV